MSWLKSLWVSATQMIFNLIYLIHPSNVTVKKTDISNMQVLKTLPTYRKTRAPGTIEGFWAGSEPWKNRQLLGNYSAQQVQEYTPGTGVTGLQTETKHNCPSPDRIISPNNHSDGIPFRSDLQLWLHFPGPYAKTKVSQNSVNEERRKADEKQRLQDSVLTNMANHLAGNILKSQISGSSPQCFGF